MKLYEKPIVIVSLAPPPNDVLPCDQPLQESSVVIEEERIAPLKVESNHSARACLSPHLFDTLL
jgi:hypothetical protein